MNTHHIVARIASLTESARYAPETPGYPSAADASPAVASIHWDVTFPAALASVGPDRCYLEHRADHIHAGE